VRAFSEIIKFR